ncbi:Putative ribonuclease H protein At1g65750 [Linum perenne]
MEKQGQAWKGKMLSQSRREILIKSVIQAVPTYLMSVFFLSSGITKKMDSIARNFFWSGDASKRSIHWSNGETFCLSKLEGGLGFRNFTDFNLALLAKQGWRLLKNPKALWVRLLKSLYFPKRDFLSAKKGARPSWIWASIFKARDTISLGALKRIGDGSTVDINYDPWIPTLPRFMTPFNGCPSRLVSDWIHQDTREWKNEEISRFFSPEHSRAILSIPIGPQGMEDDWKWSFMKNGEFSVRSAYHAKRKGNGNLEALRNGNSNDNIWKWLWSLTLPPKIKFFLWRCAKDSLATKANLHKRKCSLDDTCPICQRPKENTWHCLFTCPHAREVWSSLSPTTSFSLSETDFAQWIFPCFSMAGEQETRRMAAILWNIWKSRNEKVFRGTDPNLFATSLKVSNDVELWKQCNKRATPNQDYPQSSNVPHYHSTPPRQLPRPPPRIADIVIHCDGSFDKDSPKAAYGVVVTNTLGQVCDGKSGTFLCSSPMVAEAYAIKEAVNVAATRQVSTEIMSDCLSIVNVLNNSLIPWPWECSAIISQITQKLSSCPWISVKFTPRIYNTNADWVARSARRNTLPENWMEKLND